MKVEVKMNIPQKMILLLCCFASGTLLSGCMTGGAAFGLGAGAVHETETVEKDPNQPPPVYGPPQIIYRIDSDRYFTLENYVSCEKGETFYNNKKKDIHVKISPASGYLFKGRLYWVSTRDDYLAFPTTHNTKAAVCMGSDKGCKNVITLTVDGGKTLEAVSYGFYSSDPTKITKNYDMIVTDKGFYMINYRLPDRKRPDTDRWVFDLSSPVGVLGPDGKNDLIDANIKVPEYGFYSFDLSDFISPSGQTEMQCNRALIPKQPK